MSRRDSKHAPTLTSKSITDVTADDRSLFRLAIGAEAPDMVPVPSTTAEPTRKPPPARAVQRLLDEQRALREWQTDPFGGVESQPGDTLRHTVSGVAPRILRKLARGQYRIQGELDLHGLFVHEAEDELRRFLVVARNASYGCVRIIHGKGLRSKNQGPVLKALTDRLLRRRDDVLAFTSAPPTQGGTGAVLVLLRRRRPDEAMTTPDAQNAESEGRFDD